MFDVAFALILSHSGTRTSLGNRHAERDYHLELAQCFAGADAAGGDPREHVDVVSDEPSAAVAHRYVHAIGMSAARHEIGLGSGVRRQANASRVARILAVR